MVKRIGILLSALVFLILYFGIHYYVFTRLGGLLGFNQDSYFYLIMLIFSSSFIVSIVIEREYPNFLTRLLYTLSSIWLGVLFLLFCSLLVFEIVNIIFPPPELISGWIILGSVSLISLYSLINASSIEIKKIEIPIKNLKKEIKIVQLSDIHLGTVRNSTFLEFLLDKVIQLNPEFLVITGDLFDGSAPLQKHMLDSLNKVKFPVFFVTGNHERYEGFSQVFKILKETKVRALENKVEKFKDLQIIGINYSEDKNYVKEILKKIKFDRQKPSLLLYHTPLDLKFINTQKINLHLAGHTHKGQIFPFNFLVRTSFKNITGLHKFNDTYEYISQGSGTWGPPMRLGSRNEITLIKLKPKPSTKI